MAEGRRGARGAGAVPRADGARRHAGSDRVRQGAEAGAALPRPAHAGAASTSGGRAPHPPRFGSVLPPGARGVTRARPPHTQPIATYGAAGGERNAPPADPKGPSGGAPPAGHEAPAGRRGGRPLREQRRAPKRSTGTRRKPGEVGGTGLPDGLAVARHPLQSFERCGRPRVLPVVAVAHRNAAVAGGARDAAPQRAAAPPGRRPRGWPAVSPVWPRGASAARRRRAGPAGSCRATGEPGQR
jgi:hypothetical protein